MIRLLLLPVIMLAAFICCKNFDNRKEAKSQADLNYLSPKPPDITRLRSKVKEAKVYCERKNLNTDFFLLIDLSIHSGLKRFFIWDFKSDTVTNCFLVSHGCYTYPYGEDYSNDKAVTGNVDGSHCSSIGKYIIGKRGFSNWGINVNYLLHGQDKTNSNALKREIVLHSWDRISDTETFPQGSPEGWGCPAVSNSSMRILDSKLKDCDEQVLLWMIK